MSTQNLIQQLYVAFYGRPADNEGLAFWSQALEQNGGDVSAFLSDFVSSDEAVNRYGELSADAWLSLAFEQAFSRGPNADEQADFDRFEGDLGAVVSRIADYLANAQGDDAATLGARTQVATTFTNEVAARGSEFGPEDVEAASQLVSNANVGTDVSAYLATVVEEYIATITPEQPVTPPSQGSGNAVELVKGNPVFTLDKASVNGEAGSQVRFTEQEGAAFDAAFGQAAATGGDFGDIITLTTGDDVLELVFIELAETLVLEQGFVTSEFDFIDFALFNGNLVTAESVGVAPNDFFWGGDDVVNFFGYQWLEGAGAEELIVRPDGQAFDASVVVYDTLGVADLSPLLAEFA